MVPTLDVSLPREDGDPLMVTVRELKVSEVRAWLNEDLAKSLNPGSFYRDPIQATVFADIGLDELVRFTNQPVESLEDFSPSELQPVFDAAKALNPHFFRLQAAVQSQMDRLIQQGQPGISIGPSPD